MRPFYNAFFRCAGFYHSSFATVVNYTRKNVYSVSPSTNKHDLVSQYENCLYGSKNWVILKVTAWPTHLESTLFLHHHFSRRPGQLRLSCCFTYDLMRIFRLLNSLVVTKYLQLILFSKICLFLNLVKHIPESFWNSKDSKSALIFSVDLVVVELLPSSSQV